MHPRTLVVSAALFALTAAVLATLTPAQAGQGPGSGAAAAGTDQPAPTSRPASASTSAPTRTHGPTITPADCPDGYLSGEHPGDLVMCLHADQAPPGVDVHAPVPTAVLAARPGPAVPVLAADGAAATLAPVGALSSSSDVPCDGDGTTGYRIQGLYVVEAGAPNRFAALEPSFQRWAAGVDDVLNVSAAGSGGSRHARFVSTPAGLTCTATILPVTVPAGSLASIATEAAALRTLGYDSPDRKYLMWTDATVLCGIATMYPDDRATQVTTLFTTSGDDVPGVVA